MKKISFALAILTLLFVGCNSQNKKTEKLIGKWEYIYTVLSGDLSTSYLLINKNGDNFSITEWVEFGDEVGKHTNEETKICTFKNGCFSDQMGCYDENTGTIRKHWDTGSGNKTVEYRKVPQ